MNGRFLGIKKSIWLQFSTIFNSITVVVSSIILGILLNEFDIAFFLFCVGTGLHHIFKSFLFGLDSSCYFGTLLFSLGGFYIYLWILNILWLFPAFIVFAFAFASICVGCFYNQSFQIFLSLSLYFVGLGLLLLAFKLISIWIFLAIILISVLLLVVRYFTL